METRTPAGRPSQVVGLRTVVPRRRRARRGRRQLRAVPTVREVVHQDNRRPVSLAELVPVNDDACRLRAEGARLHALARSYRAAADLLDGRAP